MNRFFHTAGFLPCKDPRGTADDGLRIRKPNNLFAPLDIDPGTRGRFGEGARVQKYTDETGQVPLAVYALSFLGFHPCGIYQKKDEGQDRK